MNALTPKTERFVAREKLEALTREYRHVLEEHRRTGPESSVRRRLEHELDALSDRFEHVLSRTPRDEELRARWRAHLHHGAPAPTAPGSAEPAAVETAERAEPPIEIVGRGPVGRHGRERLHRELARLAGLAPRPVLIARGSLDIDENPSRARPVEARATLDLGERTIHAHANAAGTAEAIDLLVERLRRALRELRERQEGARRGPARRPAANHDRNQ